MNAISKPSAEELQPLIDEAKKTTDWLVNFLAGLVVIIKKDPLRYRTFGPYWWLVKQAMIAHDILTFGNEIDREWFELLDYGNNELNIAAAWLYENGRTDSKCNLYDDSHMLEDGNGEPYEYLISDSDMEVMAINYP